jgi:hypothetical protein
MPGRKNARDHLIILYTNHNRTRGALDIKLFNTWR